MICNTITKNRWKLKIVNWCPVKTIHTLSNKTTTTSTVYILRTGITYVSSRCTEKPCEFLVNLTEIDTVQQLFFALLSIVQVLTSTFLIAESLSRALKKE